MSFCTKCGYKLPDRANFCPGCGTPVALGVVAPEKLKVEDEIEEPTQRMNEISKIEELIQGLNTNILSIQKRAAEELGEMGDARAVEPLINTLKDEEEDLRKKVAITLGKIGDKRAVEALIKVMNEDKIFVSIEATKALGEIGGDRAVEALVKTVKEDIRSFEYSEYMQQYKDDVWVAQEAARALGKMGESALEPLIKILKEGGSLFSRIFAAEVLGEMGDTRTIEPLIKALEFEGDPIRQALIKFESKVVEPLVKALKDSNELVRKGAVDLLGRIGDPDAIGPLIETLNDDEPVQREAALALNMIGGKEAEKAVKSSGKFPFLLWPSIEKMTKTRDVEGLVKRLTHKKSIVRRKAAWALGKVGWEPKDDLEKVHLMIANLKGLMQNQWDELAKLGETALEPLIQMLKDEDWLVRMRAAYALEMIEDARAIEPLTQALKDEDGSVQSSAYSALLKIKISPLEKKRDVDGLIKALKDEDILVRERAAQALGRIGDTKAVEPLIQAINEDKYPYIVGKASKEAIKEIKTRLQEAVEE